MVDFSLRLETIDDPEGPTVIDRVDFRFTFPNAVRAVHAR
jgi:hypothetical protein